MEGLSEDFVQGVCTILAKTLSNNNEERNQHEAMYHQLLAEKPELLLLSLIAALKTQSTEIRTLAAVLLKKQVSPSSNTFQKLSPACLMLLKTELLASLNMQSERKIRELISEDIGLLGVSILTSDGSRGTWPELLPYVNQIISTGGVLRAAGLHILQAMFPYMFEEMMQNSADLLIMFRAALHDEDYVTKLACLTAMTSLISVADTKPSLVFSHLVPDMLRSVDFILEKNTYSGSQAIESLTELVQSEPKLFKASFAKCVELTQHIFTKPGQDLGLKSLILEFAVSISERIPRQIQKNLQLGTGLLKMIFEMMIAIDSDVDDSWKVPEEGFCEKDEEEEGGVDIDYAKIGRKLVSRLIDSVGDKYLLQPCLSSIHQALSDQNDWRIVYAGLMTLSEVLQYIDDDNKLSEALPIISAHMVSSHCKIRYAAFHVLGQLCEDHGPDFQKKHHETIAPKLLEGLNDSVPRVVAHACAAITNFIENLGNPLAQHYASILIPKLMTFLQNPNPSLIIENTCTCLAAIASSTNEGFKEYFLPLLQQLLVVFEKYNHDKYKALLGRLIECVTLMSQAVGKAVFHPYADKVVSLMKFLQEGGSSQEELTGYIMNGWQRICELLGEDFAIYSDGIIPVLLKLVSKNVEMSTSSNPGHFVDMALASEKKKKNFNITETENKELGLQTLITIIEELKTGYVKYVESTILITFPLLDFTFNESIRSAAAMLLSSLVSVIKPLDSSKAIVMAKTFIEGIWKAIDDEYTNETLVDELQAIREIISTIEAPFLTVEEVKIIGEKSLKILENSLENRIKVQEDSDDEEDEGFKEYTKKEEDNLHIAISEVFGILFKTHKNLCLDIVDFLCTKVFGKLLDPNTRDEDHKFVIFVIDDILEYLGQDLVADKWDSFGEVLIKFSCDPHDAVRQAAVYGIGVYAENSKVEGFAQWTQTLLAHLEKAITFPVGKSVKTHGHARDNAISSLGKLIKNHSVYLNCDVIIPAWLNLLPLKFDKIEARSVTELIASLALENPGLLFGNNYQNLRKVVNLLVEVIDTKFVKESSLPKIKETLNRLQSGQVPELANVWAELNDSQRAKVTNLMNSS